MGAFHRPPGMSAWSDAGLVLAGGVAPFAVAIVGGRHLLRVERFRSEDAIRRVREQRRVDAYAEFIAAVSRVVTIAVRVHTGELPHDDETSATLYKAR
jgi:hypothetical protein